MQNIRNTNKHIYDLIEISISGVCFITQTFTIHKYFMLHRAREKKRDAQIIHNIPIILRFLSLARMRNIQCDRLPMGKIDSMLPWLYKACFLTHKIVRIHHIVLETSIPPWVLLIPKIVLMIMRMTTPHNTHAHTHTSINTTRKAYEIDKKRMHEKEEVSGSQLLVKTLGIL